MQWPDENFLSFSMPFRYPDSHTLVKLSKQSSIQLNVCHKRKLWEPFRSHKINNQFVIAEFQIIKYRSKPKTGKANSSNSGAFLRTQFAFETFITSSVPTLIYIQSSLLLITESNRHICQSLRVLRNLVLNMTGRLPNSSSTKQLVPHYELRRALLVSKGEYWSRFDRLNTLSAHDRHPRLACETNRYQ